MNFKFLFCGLPPLSIFDISRQWLCFKLRKSFDLNEKFYLYIISSTCGNTDPGKNPRVDKYIFVNVAFQSRANPNNLLVRKTCARFYGFQSKIRVKRKRGRRQEESDNSRRAMVRWHVLPASILVLRGYIEKMLKFYLFTHPVFALSNYFKILPPKCWPFVENDTLGSQKRLSY